MSDDEAVEVCEKWFAHLERQRQKTKRLQELAAMARQGPEQQAQAQRELGRIDRQPVVFDGAYLEPAVRHLVKRIAVDAMEEGQ